MSTAQPPGTFVTELLDLVAHAAAHDLLDWQPATTPVVQQRFFIRCGDLFDWNHTDTEEITEDTFKRLRRAVADLRELCPDVPARWGLLLYVARIRRQRPHPSAYPDCAAVKALFDLAGPPRQYDPFAPSTHPAVDLGAGSFIAADLTTGTPGAAVAAALAVTPQSEPG